MLENNWHKKEEPFLSMSGLGGGAFQQVLALSADAKTYIDDVFSTDLWTGNTTTQTITNSIDLSGEGGLVWIKGRDDTWANALFDTERGPGFELNSATTGGHDSDTQVSSQKDLYQFNSNGYSIGQNYNSYINANGDDFVGWTFRKCPKFFDIVTYTGDGTNSRAISHNLDANPRLLLIKKTSDTSNWAAAYIQGPSLWTGDSYTGMYLNSSAARGSTTSNGLGVSAVSSSTFTVNNSGSSTTLEFVPNSNGATYVAYLFAEDAAFGDGSDEQICNISTYSGSGSAGKEVNVGFEPQWLLIKRYDSGTDNWMMFDNMRGVVTGGTDQILLANSSNHEDNLSFNALKFTPTGFTLEDNDTTVNASGASYWYMAIRRPHKPPTAGTDVFAIDTRGSTGDGKAPTYRSGFPVDMQFNRNVTYSGGDMQISARLMQGKQMHTNSVNQESTASTMMFDYMNGVQTDTGTGSNQYAWMFKRAPGFFDVVTYTGTGSARTVNHNLGVTPELMIVKQRDGGSYWAVYSSALGATKYLSLASNNAAGTSSMVWNDTAPTSSVFTVNQAGAVNNSGSEYIAFLFASRAGISKVGTYSGSNSAVDVDCGFSNGARFVMIKRTDASADWFIVDTSRGISSGNDPYLTLNTTDAQGTTVDVVDPLSSGFSVQTNGGAAINTSGGTYLFLAIA